MEELMAMTKKKILEDMEGNKIDYSKLGVQVR